MLLGALIKAWKAFMEYNKALKAMEALKIRDPVNAWIWEVTEHSPLSYLETLEVYEFLIEQSGAYKQHPKEITGFIIDMANRGHTADMTMRQQPQIETELNRWKYDKLKMRLK